MASQSEQTARADRFPLGSADATVKFYASKVPASCPDWIKVAKLDVGFYLCEANLNRREIALLLMGTADLSVWDILHDLGFDWEPGAGDGIEAECTDCDKCFPFNELDCPQCGDRRCVWFEGVSDGG